MFSFLQKKTRLKAALFASLVLFLLAGSLFVSCSEPGGTPYTPIIIDPDVDPDVDEPLNLPAGLSGFFQAENAYSPGDYSPIPIYGGYFVDDGFSITGTTTKIFAYYSDSTLATYWRGTIVEHIAPAGGKPGLLIIQITDVKGSFYEPPTKGKYFAYSYKNLTPVGGVYQVDTAAPYSSETGAKNTGVDTIAEAKTEYIKDEYYYSSPTYYSRTVTGTTLSGVQGTWLNNYIEDVFDQYVVIRGTTFFNFMDDVDDGDSEGAYDSTDDYDVLGLVGDIVDHTNASAASGIMYVKVTANAESVYTTGNYAAIAWKNKTSNTVSFSLGATQKSTLVEIKAAYDDANNISQFPAGSFYNYTK